ncbi:protein kinase domain-containing protein [Legionella cincinnatiensis]|uniref:protein kinase domain-containing protein n=1 Tax=Legionella cincinnatiensis TaxID=28085 RepID=UPI002379938E|nr:hypothetical protein [Legionella cincinnatiensis]
MFLGGNNSKNFKVIPANGTQPFVLKIDNRMGMPKSIEQHLRHELKEVFTPVYVERQASNIVNNEMITRTLLVTEFCCGGDLEMHCQNFPANSSHRLKSSLNIYSQMANILQHLVYKQAGFPDMKNTDWLIDPQGKIQLADTKSFVPLDKDGFINIDNLNKNWCLLITSAHMNPPEIIGTRLSADKLHSFILGKNLYQYLTGCQAAYLHNKSDANMYDFSSSIFQTEEGSELEKLIRSMIKQNPTDRISINHALLELEKIKCRNLLRDFSSYNLGDKESEKVKFIKEQVVSINNSNSLEQINTISKFLYLQTAAIKQHALNLEKAKCQTLLKELNSYNLEGQESQKASFMNEQLNNINHSNSLEQINTIFKFLHEKTTAIKKHTFDLEKTKCQTLLNELNSYNLGTEEPQKSCFIKEQFININHSNSLEQINAISKFLHKKVTTIKQHALDLEISKCESLLKELNSYNPSDKNIEIKKYTEEQTKNIALAKTYQQVVDIKYNLSFYLFKIKNTANQNWDTRVPQQMFFKEAPRTAYRCDANNQRNDLRPLK